MSNKLSRVSQSLNCLNYISLTALQSSPGALLRKRKQKNSMVNSATRSISILTMSAMAVPVDTLLMTLRRFSCYY